jgi:suppressor of fused
MLAGNRHHTTELQMTDDSTQEMHDDAAGWTAIDNALARLYPAQEPMHYGPPVGWSLGGPDPLDGISAWLRPDPVPHWHFVTYGFSELYNKESDDSAHSGYGFELTFRLACRPDDGSPPSWALNFLQNLARYVFRSGNAFDDGHWMTANGPIALDQETLICSMAFASDPELPPMDTPHGRVAFLQVVGLTQEEESAAKRWRPRALLDTLLPHMPLWVTDLQRRPLLERADVREQVEEGTRRDGSSSGHLYTGTLAWRTRHGSAVEITVGARQVSELIALLPLRLPFDRPFCLVSNEAEVVFRRGDANCITNEGSTLTLTLTDERIKALVDTLRPYAGEYVVDGLADVCWRVEKTVIRDGQGNPIETIG